MKQKFVALSSAEAKYMVFNMVACEAIWIHKLLMALFGQEMEMTVINRGNHSCIKLSENPVFHDRAKHINI
jgi:hypothetical protein